MKKIENIFLFSNVYTMFFAESKEIHHVMINFQCLQLFFYQIKDLYQVQRVGTSLMKQLTTCIV